MLGLVLVPFFQLAFEELEFAFELDEEGVGGVFGLHGDVVVDFFGEQAGRGGAGHGGGGGGGYGWIRWIRCYRV